MREMPPSYPSRRKLLAIGATLAVLATVGQLLAREREPQRGPDPAPTPSGQTDADRPRR